MPDEPILPIDHPLLSRPSARIERVDDRVREMFRVMDRAQGVGLAAVQIGRPLRLVVMDVPDGEGARRRLAMVNPKIVAASERMVIGGEGCLSMPDYDIPVLRRGWVEVASRGLNCRDASLVASGLLAVCVQHEVDHTEGVPFLDRTSRLRRRRARDHFRKVRRRHEASL